MKKIVLFLFVFMILAVNLSAQQPQYYNYNNVGSPNSYPFNQTPGRGVNWLFLPGDLNHPSPCPSGQVISQIYFQLSLGGSQLYSNLHILMAQSTITTLVSGQFYPGPWDTVYNHDWVEFADSVNHWMSIGLDTPFPYDPTKSLIIFVGQCTAIGSGLSIRQNNVHDIRRQWSAGGCPFTPYMWGDSGVVNFGIDLESINGPWWHVKPSSVTTSLNTVSAVNRYVGWIGGDNGVILRTINKGTTWTNVTSAVIGTTDVFAICGLDSNTCLVSTTSSSITKVYKTTNGGTDWFYVFSQDNGFINDIKFKDENTGFMCGNPRGGRWSLWKSTDRGDSWDSTGLYLPQSSGEEGWNNGMCLTGNFIWFGTNNSRIYKSTDFGLTWTYGTTLGCPNTYSVAFNGDVGFTGQTITMKSTNGGDNWAMVPLPGSGTVYSFNGSMGRFWYCRGSNIYWSSNNGEDFESQLNSTGTYLAMNIKQDDEVVRGWAVTNTGLIAMYYEELIGISNNHNQLPSDYWLFQNYPNPFNPVTSISYSIPRTGNVKLVVFDVLGREVSTLVNEVKTPGTYTVNFNAVNLASGIYIYRIETGDFVNTKKMVLIK